MISPGEPGREPYMGDFVTTGTTKTAVRELTTPIADMNSFQSIIQNVLDTNPWGCTGYESGGVSYPAISRSREYYSGKVVYQDAEAKVIGQVTIKAPTAAAFASVVAAILAESDIETAMAGTAAHDSSEDKFTCVLRCHSADGEIYLASFSRDKIRLSSYESDDVRTGLETWADSITALA